MAGIGRTAHAGRRLWEHESEVAEITSVGTYRQRDDVLRPLLALPGDGGSPVGEHREVARRGTRLVARLDEVEDGDELLGGPDDEPSRRFTARGELGAPLESSYLGSSGS